MRNAPYPTSGKAHGLARGTATRRVLLAAYAALIVAVLAGVVFVAAQSPTVPVVVTVRHAPTLNGRVEGSLQMLAGEYLTLNSGGVVKGDLLVPGTPTVVRNGSPIYQGTVDGAGSASPSNYQVTLNSGSEVRYVRRRIDPVTLAPVPVPPAPAGTRYVTVNSPGQSVGTWATVRNLTLNSNVGAYAVPAGTYGTFTANGGGSFVLGTAGATQASVYNFEDITLNSLANLTVVGPVVVNVANRVSVNSSCVVGSAANPQWLSLNVSRYDVTINGGQVYGAVRAPAGTVNLSAGTIKGSVACDRLSINGGTIIAAASDTTPPTVSITQPANNAVVGATTIGVSGTFADESATTVKVNGVSATIIGNTFNATVPLNEGANTLTVTATDAAGNSTNAARSVTRDTTRPALSLAQPADALVTKTAQLVVSGTVADATAVAVNVNGQSATVSGQSFTATLTLAEGSNPINVTATDAAGNSSTLSRSVVLDTVAPAVNVARPSNGDFTNESQLAVVGTFSDATAVAVKVNGAPATIEANSFSAVVALGGDGAKAVEVSAIDAAGNQTSVVRTLTLDTAQPSLNVTAPSDGAVGGKSVIDVAGSASDSSPVTVSANDVAMTVAPDGSFTGRIILEENETQVLIVATDAAGNTREETRAVKVDQTPPAIDNIDPADGARVDSPASVSAHVTDATAVTVTINGVAASAVGGDVYRADNVALAVGENAVAVRAVDAAGNESTADTTLVGIDRTPPPAPAIFPFITPTRLAFQTIEGRADSESEVTITGGESPVTVTAAFGTGMFAATVNLAPGQNIISITSKDSEGNVSSPAQVVITSDPNMAPPPAGQPSRINVSVGNAQKGLAGEEMPRPLIAIVTDRDGNAVPNVPVNFTVTAGGGRIIGGGASFDASTDGDGHASVRYVSGAEPGPQQVRASFPGNSGAAATFMGEALKPEQDGAPSSVSGVVLDQNLRALPHVLVRLGGQETRTGADGRFLLNNVASGPHQLLELIGRDQVALPGRWPNITYDFDVLPGVDNRMGRPLFLPKVNDGVALPLDGGGVVTQDTSFELPVVGGEPPVRVTARAGTRVTFPPDVTDKRLSVTRIANDRVPMVLEEGRATNLYISVQPSGALFDQPLEISFPNVDRQPPNSEVLLMSFDHDAGRYVKVGTGHVTGDGRSVVSDPGSGIRVGAWHALPPPPPQEEVTVLGHIQVEGNPAFENKVIQSAEAWVEGTRAVPLTKPEAIQFAQRIDYKVTLALPPNSAPRLSVMPGLAQANTPTVTALVWERINSTVDNNNTNTGGGQRIFPDRELLGSPAAQRTVRVRAVVNPAKAGIKVFFKAFDMDDPTTDAAPVDTNGAAGGDNIGVPHQGALDHAFAFTNAAGEATAILTVSRHPGDNYKVAASCTPGYLGGVTASGLNLQDGTGATLPNAKGRDTNMLTVWRRLHVERDSMVAPPTTGAQRNFEAGNVLGVTTSGTGDPIVRVSTNLADGSAMLDTPANFGNGRFEGGMIRIGTGAAAADTAIEGNGTDYVQNPGGFNIAAQVTRTNQPNVNGNVTSLVGTVVTLDVPANTLTNAYVGGTISVAGVSMNVTAVNPANSTVTVGALANIPFELRDDDDNTVLPNLPDTSLMEEKYAPAYILPVFDGGGAAANDKMTVAFKRNFTSDTVAALNGELAVANALESDANRADDFWIVYVLQAFQSRTWSPGLQRGDNDPNGPEAALGGVAAGLNGKGAFTFIEELRDEETEGGFVETAATVAHETAHQFGIPDCGTVAVVCAALDFMGGDFYQPGSIFSDRDLRTLRERVKSPGR